MTQNDNHGDPIASFDYAYDAVGNRTWMKRWLVQVSSKPRKLRRFASDTPVYSRTEGVGPWAATPAIIGGAQQIRLM